HAKETLAGAAEAAGWKQTAEGWRKPAKNLPSDALVGTGLAMYDRHTGAGIANAEIIIDRNAHATLHTLAPDTGTGSHTIMAQIVAEELGIPLTQVTVKPATSERAVEDAGVGANRVTDVSGQAS